MLDPMFKSLWIVSLSVGWEQDVSLVEEYEKKSLYPMLIKCHEHFHPLVKLERNNANQNIFY
jgi:hypothetical protein